jgi:hypothetical protein
MKKIAATRNYKMAEFPTNLKQVGDAVMRSTPAMQKLKAEQENVELYNLKMKAEYWDRAQEVIKGLKAFIKDKGFDPKTVKPSGGWRNYQPGSNTPESSAT